MDSSSSPFTNWVYEEWEALTSGEGVRMPEDERRARWEALLARTMRDGRWLVGLGDADLVCSLGTGILMRAGEYERARDLARSWLALPGVREHDVYYVYCVVREGIADMLCGNVEAALQSIRENLALGPDTKRWVRFVILGDLYSMADTTCDHPADARVVAFAAEVLASLEEGRLLAPRALAAKTHAELAKVIRRSFRTGRRSRS